MSQEATLEELTAIARRVKELAEQVASNLEKIVEKKSIERRMPERGDWYYYIEFNGIIHNTKWRGDEEDISLFNAFNCYPTKEAAEKDGAALQVFKELRAFSDGLDGEFVIDAKFIRPEKGYFVNNLHRGWGTIIPRFKTKGRAEQAIKHFGKRLDLIYL